MTLGLAAYLMIVGSLFIAIWKRPAVALAGVLCMFGLEQWGQATTPFFAQHQTVTNLIIGSLLVIALVVQFGRRGAALFAGYPFTGVLTMVLFLYAFVSVQWAPRTDLSMKLWSNAWPYIVTLIALSPLVVGTTDDLQAAYKALVLIGGMLTPLLLLVVPWEGRQIVLGDEGGNPLAISAMAGMVVLILVLADPWRKSNLWVALKWTLVALCLALIVRSGSRGQLFSLLCVTFLCWPIGNQLSNPKQMAVLVCIVGFLGLTTGWALQTFWAEEQTYYAGGSRWSEQAMEGAMKGRFDDAIFLVERCYESFESIAFGLGNSAAFDPRLIGIYPHFVPLEVLAEEGLVGFVMYVAILVGTLRHARASHLHLKAAPAFRPEFAALLALFLFTSLLSLKQGSLLGNLEPFLFAILLGKYHQWLSPPSPRTEVGEAVCQTIDCQITPYGRVTSTQT